MNANQIVPLLESVKIKDRNEGIRLTGNAFDILNSKDAKDAFAISKSLIHLIELEKHNATKSASAVNRLKQASLHLRLVVHSTLVYLPPMFSGIIKLLPKLMMIVEEVNFIDIIRTIKGILEQQYVIDHLNEDLWHRLIDFFLDQMAQCEEETVTNFNELLSGLKLLISPRNGLIYFPILLLNCNRLVEILKPKFLVFRIDHNLKLNMLKLINRLLIALANENFRAQHQLIHFGFYLLQRIEPDFNYYSSLCKQILIFLNLDSVYYYINFHYQVNGSKDINSLSFSIEKVLRDQLDNLHLNMKLNIKDTFGLIYNTSSEFIHMPTDWFTLNTIYLKHSDYSLWLSLRGCSRLLDCYFVLSDRSNKRTLLFNELLSEYAIKRRKIDWSLVQMNFLHSSGSKLEFLEKMIGCEYLKFQQLGLLILCFHLEHTLLQDPSNTLNENGKSNEENTDFDLMTEPNFKWSNISLLTLPNNNPFDSMITLLLTVSTNDSLTLPSYTALNSLIYNLTRSDMLPFTHSQINKMLKIILPYCKSEEFGDLASHILHNLMEYITLKRIDSSKVSDTSLINQVSNIAELCHITGPAKLNNESFKFWISFVKLMSLLGLNINKFHTNICDWILSKWNQKFNPKSSEFCLHFECFIYFATWLQGYAVSENIQVPNYNSYKGDMLVVNSLMQQNNHLLEFQYSHRENTKKNFSGIVPDTFMEAIYFNKVMQRFAGLKSELNQCDPMKLWRYKLMAIELKLNDKNNSLDINELLAIKYQRKISSIQKFELMSSLPPEKSGLVFDKFSEFLNHSSVFASFKSDVLEIDNANKDEFDLPFAPHKYHRPFLLTVKEILLFDNNEHLKHVNPIAAVVRSTGPRFNSISHDFCTWLESLGDEELLYVLFQISSVESFPWDDMADADSRKILIQLGKGPLSNSFYERNELTIVTICKTLVVFLDRGKHESEAADMIQWLLTAGSKRLILTPLAATEFMILLLKLLPKRDGSSGNSGFSVLFRRFDVRATFFEYFQFLPVCSRIILVPAINEFMTLLLTGPEQIEFYKSLIGCFKLSNGKIEEVLQYCLFLGLLSVKNSQITNSSIFNLLEIGSIDEEDEYEAIISKAFKLISSSCKVKHLRQIFKLSRLSIFRSWYLNHENFKHFPYKKIGYESSELFFESNGLELLSVVLASSVPPNRDTEPVIKEICANISKEQDANDFVISSIPLTFALAYIKGGVKNQIHTKLNSVLQGKVVHIHLQPRLALTILEIIRLIDVSNLQLGIDHHKLHFNEDVSLSPLECNLLSVYLSFDSGFELITSLLKKFANSKDNWWDAANVYFLIKRLIIDLHNSISIEAEQINVRRILLVLILARSHGGKAIKSKPLLHLLVDNVFPLVKNGKHNTEIMFMLSVVDITNWRSYEFTREMILKMLAILVEVPEKLVPSLTKILAQIRSYTGSGGDDRIKELIFTTTSIMLGGFILESEMILNLESDDVTNYVVDGSYLCLFKLYSYCLCHGIELRGIRQNSVLVKALIDTSLAELSPEFKLLAAKILNNHYFDMHMTLTENYQEKVYEFDDIDKEVKYFDEMVKVIGEFQSGSCETSSLADLTIGSLSYLNEKMMVNEEHIWKCDPDVVRPFFTKVENIEHRQEENRDSDQNNDFNKWALSYFLSILNEASLKSTHPGLPIIERFAKTVECFSSSALPYLACYFLQSSGKRHELIVQMIRDFLNNKEIQSRSLTSIILKAVLLIRSGSKLPISSFKKVYQNLNFLLICEIATKFNLAKTSLMLLEDAVTEDRILNWYKQSYVEILFESIEDTDLINGLPQETNLDTAMKNILRQPDTTEKMKFEFAAYDSLQILDRDDDENVGQLVHTMLDDGLTGITSIIGNNIGSTENGDSLYEWSWKLNHWTLSALEKPVSTNEYIYKALKMINDGNSRSDGDHMERLLIQIIDEKDRIFLLFNTKEIHNSLTGFFQKLSIISSLCSINSSNGYEFDGLLDNEWLRQCSFESVDHLLLSRIIGYHVQSNSTVPFNHSTKTQNANKVISELVRYNDIAICHNRDQKIINSLMLLRDYTQKNETLFNDTSLRTCKFQMSKGLWHQRHENIAISMLKELADDIKGRGDSEPYFKYAHQAVSGSMVNATLIEWLAESKQELPITIMENHVDVLDAKHDIPLKHSKILNSEIFIKLARFCEAQYKSNEINEKLLKIEKHFSAKRRELDKIKDHYGKISVPIQEKKSVQKYYSKLKLQYTNEVNDFQDLKDIKTKFLIKAIDNYLNHVQFDDHDFESIDKIFSLWFADSSNEKLNELIRDNMDKILSLNHRFATWSSQLISKLSNDLSSSSSSFQGLVQSIIKAICKNHPYHSLYHLISLKAHELKAIESDNQFMLSKITACDKILEFLQGQDHEYIENYLEPIKRFCQQSLNLSCYKASRGKTLNLAKAGNSKLGDYWVNNLDHIAPPTKSINLQPQLTAYENVPKFESMDPNVTIASSGLSLPKIGKFRLTNGEEIKILFKHGSDDLRQDAIMEQVFEKVNQIFNKNRETSSRKLRVRTYKIIPIGSNSGLIEFVPNSTALIDIVKPYHNLKDDMRYEKARELMKDHQTEDRMDRIKTFEQICEKTSPVLRLFFFDNYLTPKNWFETKVTYSHGLATSSIVGHMLGLGDRHCNNILLDKKLGEPIHIDLGVAFDQGTRLPIPETVPFRLTRDLVNGLGITGVEGIFRNSCEQTFQVLRNNQDHIISILNILKWDPLYSWNLSPLRKRQLQNDNDVSRDNNFEEVEDDISEAGQAVSKVQDKLKANGLSTGAVVRELIINAMNKENLALIYCGWCPFY